MKIDIKELWSKALRSGEYKQGRHSLKDKYNEYCCLGVLCDLYGKEQKVEWHGDGLSNTITFLDEEFYLPKKVVEWCGIKDYKGKVKFEGKSTDLGELNDDERLTFNEIADLIEEQF